MITMAKSLSLLKRQTIKKDGFSYNIVGGSYSHILNTKDDLEINTKITIGVK